MQRPATTEKSLFATPCRSPLVTPKHFFQYVFKLFARLWGEHSVLGREGGARTFNHPTQGHLRYEQVTFNVANRQDLKLVMLIQQKS